MVLFLWETPVKRTSTKYLSFKNVHYAKLIYSANRQNHAIPSGLFVKAKVLPLNVLYFESILNSKMYDVDERN